MSSTICALATPPGAGGIAVVRVSGPEAYTVVEEIFTPRNPAKRVAEAKGYTAMLGHYHLRGEAMDETIALFFRAPHSYTGEDVIELSVHGGNAMAQGSAGKVRFGRRAGTAHCEHPGRFANAGCPPDRLDRLPGGGCAGGIAGRADRHTERAEGHAGPADCRVRGRGGFAPRGGLCAAGPPQCGQKHPAEPAGRV